MNCKPPWKKPSFGQKVLTEDEALVAETLRLCLRMHHGLHSRQTQSKEVEMAKQRYETEVTWPQEELDRYEAFMKGCIENVRKFRAHGMPRQWPKQIDLFWYWVATRQQYDE